MLRPIGAVLTADLSISRVKLDLIRQLNLLAIDLDSNHVGDLCLVLTRFRLVALDPSSSGGGLVRRLWALRHLLDRVRQSLSLVLGDGVVQVRKVRSRATMRRTGLTVLLNTLRSFLQAMQGC